MKKTLATLLALTALFSADLGAGTNTKKVGATKIHGDGYKCESFETSPNLDEAQRKEVLTYGILASSAYADRNDANAMLNGGQGRVDNWKALEDEGYRPLTKEETERLLSGSKLNVSEVPLSGDKAKGIDYVTTVNVSGDNPDTLNIRLFEGPGNTLVVAYRGTAGVADIIDDAKQTSHLGMTPQQYKDAATALQTIVANTSDDPKYKNIVCTGHSLGGGLVQYAMASTDLQGRVKGYTYNSAGLNGLQTVNNFDEELAKKAVDNIIGVRNDRDPVSWVGFHLLKDQKMYEVSTEVQKGEHSIDSLIMNMIAATNPEFAEDVSQFVQLGTTDIADLQRQINQLGQDMGDETALDDLQRQLEEIAKQQPQVSQQGQTDQQTQQGQTDQQTQQGQSSQQQTAQQPNTQQQGGTGFPPSLETFVNDQLTNNQDWIDTVDDAFAEVQGWLDAVLPTSTATQVADKLEELAKKGLLSAAGAVDKAVQAEINKIKAEIVSHMPGDASKQQMAKLIDDALASKDLATLKSSLGTNVKDLGTTLAGDYAAKVVDGMNLPAEEKAALKKTISDAVQAYVKGSGISGAASTVKGNIENYVYEKVKTAIGQEAADAWKKAYTTWQGGGNPWNDIKAAAKTTIETWGFKQLEKVIDKQLNNLLKNHPVLKEVFSALGIDTKSIMGTIKNIWGVLTGGGTLKEKFESLAKMAVQGLANMLKSLIKWGIGKLQAWLNGIITKIGGIIKTWLQKLLGGKFHLPQKIVDLVLKGVDAAVNAATKGVGSVLTKGYVIATNKIQDVVDKVLTSGGSGSSQPPSSSPPKVDPNKVKPKAPVKPQISAPVPGLQH